MKVLAIDFGTSRIKAAYWDEAKGEAVMLPLGNGGRLYIPSLFHVSRDGKIRFGEAAERELHHDPSGVLSSLKLDLDKAYHYLPERNQVETSALMSLLFRQLIEHSVREVRGFNGNPPEKVVLTYPAKLDYEEIYSKALRDAGFEGEVVFIREPEAAGWAWVNDNKPDQGELLVVLDFGGGTVDWTCLRVDENHRPVMIPELRSDSMKAAGIDVDEGLFDEMMNRLGESQRDYVQKHRALVMEQICQMKELQNSKAMLSGEESQTLEVRLEAESFVFETQLFADVVRRKVINQALGRIEEYLKKVVEYQRNAGSKQFWCMLAGGTRQLSGLEEQVNKKVKEIAKAGGMDVQFAEVAQADFATVRGAVSQFFAVDEKIATPEEFVEKVWNSEAPVAEVISEPNGNNSDKRNENPDTVYYGRTKEDPRSYWFVGVFFFIPFSFYGFIGVALFSNGSLPLIPLFITEGVVLAISVMIAKQKEALHCGFHLNSSFDSLKERFFNTKSYEKYKVAITELGDNRFRIIASVITWDSKYGLSFSTNVLFAKSENGDTILVGSQNQMIKFIRKNINQKAVFVLKNN